MDYLTKAYKGGIKYAKDITDKVIDDENKCISVIYDNEFVDIFGAFMELFGYDAEDMAYISDIVDDTLEL